MQSARYFHYDYVDFQICLLILSNSVIIIIQIVIIMINTQLQNAEHEQNVWTIMNIDKYVCVRWVVDTRW